MKHRRFAGGVDPALVNLARKSAGFDEIEYRFNRYAGATLVDLLQRNVVVRI
jgi:hypothetical protein